MVLYPLSRPIEPYAQKPGKPENGFMSREQNIIYKKNESHSECCALAQCIEEDLSGENSNLLYSGFDTFFGILKNKIKN